MSLWNAYTAYTCNGWVSLPTYPWNQHVSQKIWEFNTISWGSLSVSLSGSFFSEGGGASNPNLYVKLDGTTVYTYTVSNNGWSTSTTITVPNWIHNIQLYIEWHSDGGGYRRCISNCDATFTLTPKIRWKTAWGGVPTKVIELGKLMVLNIFGIFDGEFFVWVETENATTWSITPWNFVGYLQIWDYKIPYYK